MIVINIIINYNSKFNANDKYYFNQLDFCNNKERIFQSDLCIIKRCAYALEIGINI